MTYDDLPYLIQPMQVQDIPEVMEIERVCFSMPWSTRAYRYEIEENRLSTYMVARVAVKTQADGLWDRVREMLSGGPAHSPVIGYGGFWIVLDEAHISTIAVHPDYRGQGLGELLLAGMLQRGIYLGGEYSVLEVRASNSTAQALYEKYEYKVVGRRKAYYRDNSEDALLMEVRPLDAAYRQRLAQRVEALQNRVSYTDHFTRQNKA